MNRSTIGDLLLRMNAIDELQLRAMIGHQKRWGLPLGRIAVEQGFCTWRHVLCALSAQTGLPAVDLEQHRADARLGHLIGEKLGRKHKAVPLALLGAKGDTLAIAIAAPAPLSALDELAKATRKKIQAYIAADHALELAVEQVYGSVARCGARFSGDAQVSATRSVGQPARAQVPLYEQEFELDAA